MLQGTLLRAVGKVLLLANRKPDIRIEGGKVVDSPLMRQENEEKSVGGINPKYIQGNRKFSQEAQTKKALDDLKSIGTERIKQITCICCEKIFGDHSHKELLRCIQLMQNTNCAWGYELSEYKAIEQDQIRDLRKKQEEAMLDDKKNMAKLSDADSGHSGWKEVDTSQEGEKEMLDQIKERMGGMEDAAKINHEKELKEKGSTMFETTDEEGRPITVEAIDPESDLGKKILKEQEEKKKHGKSN
jgi:hypothetical protein